MDISTPKEYGVLSPRHEEIVARLGRSVAAVNIARYSDTRYRQSVSFSYSYGGFSGPVSIESEGYCILAEAVAAGMEELLRRWPQPFHSDPQSVHRELAGMREQVVSKTRQPSLF